ncbi:hypothetical protein BsWGS_18374 [Bradybaena similaris]
MLTSKNKQATGDTDTRSCSSRPVDMQWETKGQFSGQVKPVGIEKSMGWKTGFVHFDYDAASSAWMVRLYLKVNPSRVCQQMTIGCTDNLDVKCGRLMIENKKGDGIHIKLSNADVTHAKLLVSKIKNSIATTATGSKAEVGISSHTTLSSHKAEVGISSHTSLFSHKGSVNVSQYSGEDWFDLSLFQASADMSPEQSVRRLAKNSTPRTGSEHDVAPKRKLELFSPERLDVGSREKDVSTPHRFTGVKDYSKRNLHGGTSLSVGNVIGPKSFYSTQKPSVTNNLHRNTQVNSYEGPVLKKPKLSLSSSTIASRSPAPGHTSDVSRSPAPGHTSDVSRSPAPGHTSDVSGSRDSSPSVLDNPQHHVQDGETIGFQNLGNTCFLNAPLQCLSALEPLTLDIQSAVARYGKELKSSTVTRKLYQLMKDVRRNDVCPDHIKELLVTLRVGMNVKFAPNTQQDAHELLSELLNRMDEEVKVAIRLQASTRLPLTTGVAAHGAGVRSLLEHPASEAPIAMPLYSEVPTPTESNFCWSYRTCIYFHQCKTEVVSSQTEQEMTLMLALDPTTKNLQDCIRKYFESTEVEMKCEKCGRDENATITRKIVRRPRVFILNLLRYHSDNVQFTKKADLIRVPSYISFCDYCADDVVKPTPIDAVLLLDRLNHSNEDVQNAVDAENAFARVLSTWERGQQKQARPPAGAGHHQDKPEILSELVAVLADLASCNLSAVTTYMEDIHNRGEDINTLYLQAQNAIYKLRTNIATALKCKNLPPDSHVLTSRSGEMLLSEILLKKSLLLDEAQLDSLPEDAMHMVIEDLLVTHYGATDNNDKCMNYLINDLGLCVVVMESGAVDVDSPNQRAVLARLHVTLEKLVLARSSVAFLDRSCPDGDSDMDIGGEEEGSHVQVEDDVYFKRTQPLKVAQVDGSPDMRTSQDHVSHQIEKNVENLSNEWYYAHWGDMEEKQRHPLSDITVQTSYRALSPDSNSDMLQGKHISSYIEADLLNIDTASLTDEETIVFVTALSRFEYEKEQASMLGMCVTDSCDWPETAAGEQAGAHTTHLQAGSEKGASLNPSAAHGVGSCTAEVRESCSGSSPAHAGTEMSSEMCTSDGDVSVGLGPYLRSGAEAVGHRMLCREQIVDCESAGNSHDSSGERSIQTATALREPIMGADMSDTSIKHCVSCGSLCLPDCTVCGALDQTDFDCYPLDASLCTLPAETAACPKSKDTEESSLILCGKGGDLSLVGDLDVMTREAQPCIRVAAVDKHGGQQCSVAASRKEFLFSPPKTNNLTRTRDYARLKSLASSPKKRTAKGPSPKYDCVAKRHHYSEKEGKLTPADRIEGVGSSNPELHDTSMELKIDDSQDTSKELNVNDLSFFEHQQTVDAAAVVLNHQSTPPAYTGSRHDNPGQTLMNSPTSASTIDLEVSNLSSQVSHLSGVQDEALNSSIHTPRNRVAASEGLLENIQLQVSVTPKRKVIRSSATCIPDVEEKENVHQDRSKGGQFTVMEDGRQDLSYKLVSVVDHTGSSQFTGHYTAYAFNISRQTWFHLNDIETRSVTEGAVREANSKTGYLFFYMDKDLFDEYSSKTSSGVPRS